MTKSAVTSDTYASFLAGYEVVPPDSTPFITLDGQRRFYLNASLRKLIGIKAFDRVALAYHPDNKSLALLIDEAVAAVNAPTYYVDARHYMSARRFFKDYRFDTASAPYTFEFDRTASVGGIYFFRLKTTKEL